MHDHAGRLVDRDYVAVLVQDVEGNLLRPGVQWRRIRRLHVDRFENVDIILPASDAANADAARGGVVSEAAAEPLPPIDAEIAQLTF